MTTRQMLTMLCVGVVCLLPRPVMSHGRLWEPPGRSTMWRRGFQNPKNYRDNELYCGGFTHQVHLGYKCGVCGDAYDHQEPKPNEAGGMYANGIITRTYTQGQRANFSAQLTANHLGYFEYKICPTNDYKVKATQDCLDLHPVPLADGSGTRHMVGSQKGYVETQVVIPDDLSCDFCVLQWRYHAGNTWGKDETGRSCTGCGPQEEFYGCSDIRILPKDGHTMMPTVTQPTTPKPATPKPTTSQSTTPQPATQRPTTQRPTTQQPATQQPTTPQPTTQQPTTPQPTTQQPTTQQPTTQQPATQQPTTKQPTTQQPTTQQPTTSQPTTSQPNTQQPTTPEPSTEQPTTQQPTSAQPNTQKPTTQQPLTTNPTTALPITQQPTTQQPITQKPTTQTPQPTHQPTTHTLNPQTHAPHHRVCHGTHNNHVFDDWCKDNCRAGNCPSSVCVCGVLTHEDLHQKQCHPIGVYAKMGQYANWCNINCRRGYCPHNICRCA